jgi:hypothetical protein
MDEVWLKSEIQNGLFEHEKWILQTWTDSFEIGMQSFA